MSHGRGAGPLLGPSTTVWPEIMVMSVMSWKKECTHYLFNLSFIWYSYLLSQVELLLVHV